MQDTRKHILEILNQRGEATVDDLVHDLKVRRGAITAVTVRHHLNHLQREQLITTVQLRHRNRPGRPQHIYTLTSQARDQFPNNYRNLATGLLTALNQRFTQSEVNVILEDVADRFAAEASIPNAPLLSRIEQAVTYLNQHGYEASWENHADGYILKTTNCPYHHISHDNQALCSMDMRLISSLLGVVPRLLGRISDGQASCAYLIPEQTES